MVIQCPECRTQFRFADERMKPAGVKVRCARCAHVFLAAPPAQEHPISSLSTAEAPEPLKAPAAWQEESWTPAPSSALDGAAADEEDPFADLPDEREEAPSEASPPEEGSSYDFTHDLPSFLPTEEESPFGEPENEGASDGLSADAGDFFRSAEEQPDPFSDPLSEKGFEASDANDLHADAFSFEEPDTAPSGGDDFAFEETTTPPKDDGEFGFDKSPLKEDPDSFSFEKSSRKENDHFSFGNEAPEATGDFEYEANSFGDFSFDSEETERDVLTDIEDRAIQTGEEKGDGLSFERTEKTPKPPALELSNSSEFFNNEPLGAAPAARPPAAPPVSSPAPEKKKGGAMSRLLLFVLILLLALVGLAGYVVWQGGPEEVVRILNRLDTQNVSPAPAGQIRLGDLRGFFIQNTESGQLFIISGHAVNEHQDARSAIAIKGILYNPQGQPLLQQTVFAGNPVKEDDLRRLPFERIEEQMNNQFGESLSNLNILPGKSIPFTIVFRDLPEELAEFTVEIADSRPGSG